MGMMMIRRGGGGGLKVLYSHVDYIVDGSAAAAAACFTGDNIYDTVKELSVFFGGFCLVYIMAFIFLFIYIILNAALCIVTGTLFFVRNHEKTRRRVVHRLIRKPQRGTSLSGE